MPGDGGNERADDDDLPDQPFEVRALRQILPGEMRILLGARRRELIVEAVISEKILRDHPADHVYLQQLGHVLEYWEFAGPSPKAPDRFEIYARIDDVWFASVIRCDQNAGYSSLVTMHRIYRRKVESRARRGYLCRERIDLCPDGKNRELQ